MQGRLQKGQKARYRKNKYCEAYNNFFDYAMDRMLYIAKNTN